MNKKVLYTLSTAFLLSSLTACNGNNTDEGAMGNRNNDTVRPIGYYSDENVNRSYGTSYNNDNGNAILPERDNDGPITEMLDRATGDNNGTYGRGVGNLGTRDDGLIGDNNRRGTNVNTTNDNRGNNFGANYGTTGRNVDMGANNNAVLPKNNHFSRDDYNYHGQVGGRNNNARTSYTNNYNGGLAEQISNRVEKVNNVDDVRTIVNGDEILVAVDTNDRNNKQVQSQVKNAIRDLTKGKDVRVVTDESIFTRARNIDNELRDGGPTDNLDADVRDMFREVRNGVNNTLR